MSTVGERGHVSGTPVWRSPLPLQKLVSGNPQKYYPRDNENGFVCFYVSGYMGKESRHSRTV